MTRGDRARLEEYEWGEWRSRGVWNIRSVAASDEHEATMPAMFAGR